MGRSDYYVDPEGRYVEVHPLTTRLIQVGRMTVGFDETVWPPPEVIDNFWVDYAADREELAHAHGSGGDELAPGFWYSDQYVNFEGELSGNRNAVGGPVIGHDAGIARMFWDLASFPFPLSEVERVELVTFARVAWGTSGLTEQPEQPDPYAMKLTWDHDFTEPYGLPIGPEDWKWGMRNGDAFVYPIRELVPIQEREILNPFQETELFLDSAVSAFWGDVAGWYNYYAFPLEFKGKLRPSRVGLVLSLGGLDPPTQQNFVSYTAYFYDIDDYEDESLRFRFFEMPKLRLWRVVEEAPETITMAASGAMRLTGGMTLNPRPRGVQSHTARLRRNRGG